MALSHYDMPAVLCHWPGAGVLVESSGFLFLKTRTEGAIFKTQRLRTSGKWVRPTRVATVGYLLSQAFSFLEGMTLVFKTPKLLMALSHQWSLIVNG